MTKTHTIGLALGSGAARGLSHFGVIRELKNNNLPIDIVCGSSMGALVGAAYVTGHLDDLEGWFRQQTTTQLIRHLDINLFAAGGIADGEEFIRFLTNRFGDYHIEELDVPYAAIACDMNTGKEVWITQGSIWEAVRASGAYPGLLTPVKMNHHWLVDGGIVNPVPVSVCRALGADSVIAVNLNAELVKAKPVKSQTRKHKSPEPVRMEIPMQREAAEPSELDIKTRLGIDSPFFSKVGARIRQAINDNFAFNKPEKDSSPGIMEVIQSTVNIMQDRITRSRLAGDPADLQLNPRLDQVGFFDTDRADEIIDAGRTCVQHNLAQLDYFLQLTGD